MAEIKKSVIPLSLVKLGNRVGDTAHWQKDIVLPETIGTADLSIPAGEKLAVELQGIALSEGVSISVSGRATASGNCVRCLRELAEQIEFARSEVYYYPEEFPQLTGEDTEEILDDYDERYQLFFPHELDLEPLLIDAIVPQIPLTVLCTDDCPGLCPDCGIPLAEAPSEHSHLKVDPRWSALSDYFSQAEPH